VSLSNRAFALVDALLALIRQIKSNLQMALSYLEGLGYTCCAEKLKTSDFGVPQRRDHFLLKDDDRVVLAELNHRLNAGDRRAQRKASSEPGPSSSGDKWREQHSNLAEQLGVKWPLTPSTHLTQSRWFEALPDREQQATWLGLSFCFSFISSYFYRITCL
jgi:site-specific DNA-cytosine methylase